MNTKSTHTHTDIIEAAGRRYLCHFHRLRRGGYVVTCPQFLPLSAFGEDLAQTRAKARADIEAWIEYAECREMEPTGAAVSLSFGD